MRSQGMPLPSAVTYNADVQVRLSENDLFYKFCLELSNSELLTSTPVDDLRVLVDCYNSTLNTLIDLHAPIVYKPVTLRSRVPWFTEEIRSAKELR